ncbi:unnamed protein product [Merluccius merluccius]
MSVSSRDALVKVGEGEAEHAPLGLILGSLWHSWSTSTDQGRLWLKCTVPLLRYGTPGAEQEQAGTAVPDVERPLWGND